MYIAVCQGVESLKIVNTINLKTGIWIGVNWAAGSTTDVDDLIVILFYPIKFDPGNMMINCVGMGGLVAHRYTYDVLTFLVSFSNLHVRNVLLLSLILFCFDNLCKIHFSLLSNRFKSA